MLSSTISRIGSYESIVVLQVVSVILKLLEPRRHPLFRLQDLFPGDVKIPVHPPRPEHMILQSGSLLQCGADQLCPSSCAVKPTRAVKLLVNLDCESP